MDTKQLLTALVALLSAFKTNVDAKPLIEWLNERSPQELETLLQRISIRTFCGALAWMSNADIAVLAAELKKAYELSSRAFNECTQSGQVELLRSRTSVLEHWKMLSFGFSSQASE